MADMMLFPDTVEEFMEQYKITDTEHIYTNGTDLVPIFRMKQWFEHLPSAQLERKKGEPMSDLISRQAAIDALIKLTNETIHGLLGGKPMNDIKALIEELEVQYEAWGKQYTFAMIIRDIEKFAAGGDADAESDDR